MSAFVTTGTVSPSITRTGRNEPFDLQVGRGHTTTPQTVWEGANNATQNNYTYLSTASQLTLASSSTSDTGVVFISGLDANFNLQSETLTLNGTTAVTSVNSYLRVNGLYCTNFSNVGTITAKVSTTVYGQINPGFGQTQMAVYTVPNGYTFYQTLLQANSTLANQAVLFQTQEFYNLPSTLVLNGYSIPHNQNTQQAQISPFSTGFFNIPFTVPIPYSAGCDLQWQAKTNSGGINGSVSCFIGGYLIKNDGTL